MLLVIDTNIIVNAIKSRDDKARSVRLLEDIMNGVHTMCVSRSILREYEDVLHRPQLELDERLVDLFLSFIRLSAVWIEPLPTTQHEVEMSDEMDRIFFDVARCMNVRLVTRNFKHYPVHELVTLLEELYP